jgi:hypothetical protein
MLKDDARWWYGWDHMEVMCNLVKLPRNKSHAVLLFQRLVVIPPIVYQIIVM